MTDEHTPPPGPAPAPGPGTGPGATPPGAPGAGPTGHHPADPPPLTALAWRHRLSRPRQGRIFAGVCAGAARATNTDPVLWRVVAVVLAFSGIGILAYLAAWLAIPADGDTGSPIEAVLGRGRSSSSKILVVVSVVVLLLCIAATFDDPWHTGWFVSTIMVAGLIAIAVVALVMVRDQSARSKRAPVNVEEQPGATGTGSAVEPGAFAPHGPYQPATPPPPSGHFPTPPPPPVPPVPPPPPRPRSRLGLFTFSLMLVVLGGMVALDVAGLEIVPAAYPAVALATVGIGLIIGTWFGRARGLIALGILLAILLGTVQATDGWDLDCSVGARDWAPQSVAQLEDEYRLGIGDGTLDLRGLDFSGIARREIAVKVGWGNLRIILPPQVDAEVVAKVDIGSADVFGQRWKGIGEDSHTVTDNGYDGPGGGSVRIVADVDLGNLEVSR